jgi:hypothetical protein
MESSLTPEFFQQDDVVAWGATSTRATLADTSSSIQRESIPSLATRDQPPDPSQKTMAATTPLTTKPDETTVTSTPTHDQHLRRGTRHRLPSFEIRESGESLLTALPPNDHNITDQHVTDGHLQMHWATVLLAEAPGLPRESTESVMTLLQHGPAETYIESNNHVTPKTMREALRSPKNKEWKAAIKKEYDGIRDRNVFRVVPIPAGKRVLSTKWDFTIKNNKDDSIRKYKARWVVRGFAQREGEDFDKSKLYAHVVSFSSVRTALAMAAQWKWPIYQLDVVAAFLYADIHEELYISLPHGFKEFDSNGMELFGRLQKALYGTKQAAYEWRSKFDKFLTSHGFITSTGDPGVYLNWSSSQQITLLGIILVYVDDLINFPSSKAWMDSLRDMIRSTFDITDEGICTWVLDMGIDHNPDGSITLHHEKYIQDMLQQFNMTSCNPIILPWRSGDEFNFSRDDQPLP